MRRTYNCPTDKTFRTFKFPPFHCNAVEYFPFRWNLMGSMNAEERSFHTKIYRSKFDRDITIFDGTQVLANTALTKTWRLQNTGEHQWPEGCFLEQISGDKLGCSQPYLQKVQSGSVVDVSIQFVTPAVATRHISYYKLRAPNGEYFGDRLRMIFQVVSQENFDSDKVLPTDLEEFIPDNDTEKKCNRTAFSVINDHPGDVKILEQKSDGYVEVTQDHKQLATKLARICKLNVDIAEQFLDRNDESLVQAMIDNGLLRELHTAVTNSCCSEKQPEDRQVASKENFSSIQSEVTDSQTANNYNVALECLKSMGFEGDQVADELIKNQGRVEDTLKALSPK